MEGTKVLDYEKRKSELSLVGLKFLIIVTAFFLCSWEILEVLITRSLSHYSIFF